ncbi:MAG: hypothetical protein KVP17_001294 [Porospora cf. gigantea B]|uniref:uncharacterized protein n=1 Tax=Porospora cf. gigantea B TaxID=2853592 RepID=UPI003571F4C4|nr:MAG: hypothetical protein KVP17_001294 [Porospora cf. gigantea B]
MLGYSVSDSGLQVYRFTEEGQAETLVELPEAEVAQWSPDGRVLAVASATPVPTLSVFDGESLALLHKWSPCVNKIVRMQLSPQGNFVALCSRYEVSDPKNFRIVRLSDGEILVNHALGNYVEAFPPCQWSSKETFLGYQATGRGVDVYRMSDPLIGPGNAAWTTVTHDRMTTFHMGLEKGTTCLVATASTSTRKKKSAPGSVKVTNLFAPNSILQSTSYFNCDSVTLMMNHDDTGLIAITHSEVDSTGQSYYGKDVVYLLPLVGAGKAMQPITEGPIHDITWSTTENKFAAVSGPIPPKVTLFDGTTGKPLVDFGTSRRNTLRFSKCGRFLLSGGFGNMAGLTDIWDLQKLTVVGSNRLDCTVLCSWAPDSRWILCASALPRMKIDNHFKIVQYNGAVLATTLMDGLTSFEWRPENCEFMEPDATLQPVGYGEETKKADQLSKETNVGTAKDLSKPNSTAVPGADFVGGLSTKRKNKKKTKAAADEGFAFTIETPTF